MIAPARRAALQALQLVASGRLDLGSALAYSRRTLEDERDRALALDIATGTLRWQRSLDHLIEHLSRRSLEALDSDVHLILRLSLYQLLHLDRVPPAAVVDDGVNLVRAARKASAAGFVNAVLRGALRTRDRLPLPPRPSDPDDRTAALRYLGVTHSHPEWLVGRLLDRYGFEAAEAWVRFDNTPPGLTIRANTLRITREALQAALADQGIDAEPTRYAADGLAIRTSRPLGVPPDGSFVVQDEASQIVPTVVGARPGETVLDLCASPGGKTTAMSAGMRDTGLLVATDVRNRRITVLRDTIRSSGARHVRVVRIGHAGRLPFADRFDRVLVDAPCSGLGTIRRDPDIRWRRTEADLHTLAEGQRHLLGRAAEVVKPGGRLVYATCSSESEENESVVDAFLAAHPAWTLVDLRTEMPAAVRPLINERGMLRTLPHAHGLEAFFAAALTASTPAES